MNDISTILENGEAVIFVMESNGYNQRNRRGGEMFLKSRIVEGSLYEGVWKKVDP